MEIRPAVLEFLYDPDGRTDSWNDFNKRSENMRI